MSNRRVIKGDLKDFVLQINKERSLEYTNPAAQLARQLYRQLHPTEILVQKCMDGRLNLSVFTGIPAGILQPFRNIGGRFDLGWPFFQEVTNDGIQYAINRGRRCLAITSYHFSGGDHHRGCAGFGYDTDAAKNAALALRDQFTKVYGEAKGRPVYALTIGIETDFESIVFHGAGDKTLDVASLDASLSQEEIDVMLAELYPDMDIEMRADLVPLVKGNLAHISEVRAEHKAPIDLEHREQIIAVGRGFDWLHEPNRALIIGPYSHEWPQAVKTAGSIVLGNFNAERIPTENGVLLLVSTLWRNEERESGRRLKEEKARYIARTALLELQSIPELKDKIQILVGVTEAETRKLYPIEFEV